MLVPAEDDAGRHRRDDAGNVEQRTDDIGVPAEQAGGGDNQRVVAHPAHDGEPEIANGDADHQSAEREEQEAADRRARIEGAAESRRDGEAKQDEAGGVVEQALAFEQGLQPARQGDALEHRPGGDRVRRRDDRAEREAGRPGQSGHEHVDEDADGQGGEQDGADGERQYAGKVAAEAAEGGVKSAVHQQRRQETGPKQARDRARFRECPE